MSTRILILTAGFGEGHNAAAGALAAACNAMHGEGTAKVVDAFALAAPRLNAHIRACYLGVINSAPGLWSGIYSWLDRSNAAACLRRMLLARAWCARIRD